MESATALLETAEGAAQGATSSSGIRSLHGWKPSQPLIAHRHGNLCILTGQLRSDTWIKPDLTKQGNRFVAQLPKNCYPSNRLMFSTYGRPNGVPLRIDVLANGRVEVIADVHKRALVPEVNLQGIVFSTAGGNLRLKLSSGFSAYGHGYDKPMARQEQGLCHLQGTLGTSGRVRAGKLATLPAGCRPARKQMFNAANNMYVHQLVVHPSGELRLTASKSVDQKRLHGGGKKDMASFISLDSITFPIPMEAALGEIAKMPCDRLVSKQKRDSINKEYTAKANKRADHLRANKAKHDERLKKKLKALGVNRR